MAVRKRKRKFTLRRFWAALKLPFLEVGGEWKPNTAPRRRVPSRKAMEARIRRELEAEVRETETPMQQMLREIEDDSTRKFRRALREGELGDIGAYGLVRVIAGNERRRKREPPRP